MASIVFSSILNRTKPLLLVFDVMYSFKCSVFNYSEKAADFRLVNYCFLIHTWLVVNACSGSLTCLKNHRHICLSSMFDSRMKIFRFLLTFYFLLYYKFKRHCALAFFQTFLSSFGSIFLLQLGRFAFYLGCFFSLISSDNSFLIHAQCSAHHIAQWQLFSI